MADIPQAIIDRLDAQQKIIDELLKKTDANTVQSVREKAEADLDRIRKESLFQGLGRPLPHKQAEGPYPMALYRQTTQVVRDDKTGVTSLRKDVRGDIAVDRMEATSDAHKAQLLADGWFVNPLGIPEGETPGAGFVPQPQMATEQKTRQPRQPKPQTALGEE